MPWLCSKFIVCLGILSEIWSREIDLECQVGEADYIWRVLSILKGGYLSNLIDSKQGHSKICL